MIVKQQARLYTFAGISSLAHVLLFYLATSISDIQVLNNPPATLPGQVSVQIAINESSAGPVQQSNLQTKEHDLEPQGAEQGGQGSRTPDNGNEARARQTTSPESGRSETALTELQRLLLAEIDQRKRYPLAAIRLQQEGTTRIGFRLRRTGHIDTLAVVQSSGHRTLDQAALSAINNIQPFAPASRLIRDDASLQVDIVFHL